MYVGVYKSIQECKIMYRSVQTSVQEWNKGISVAWCEQVCTGVWYVPTGVYNSSVVWVYSSRCSHTHGLWKACDHSLLSLIVPSWKKACT